ncbi:hypothetical protein ACFVT2_38935 [Streptomyces sp. NPDC058000]
MTAIRLDSEPASVTATPLVALATAVAAVVLARLPPDGRHTAQLRPPS